MAGALGEYTEHGGSWRSCWIVAAAMAVMAGFDLALPGGGLPPLAWGMALLTALGIVAAGCRSARRVWTVRGTGRGADGELTVGRERVVLSTVDGRHLRTVDSGVDAGAPVLGGGWSLPRGRTGLPLRLTDGRTVPAPTRDPSALRAALLAALSVPRGTLGA